MLQQTRVEAVREPFGRFLQRFPTPGAFAAASDDELLVAWRGLGYYRRARLLREGARAVVAGHGGQVPTTVEALGALPGIGDYTRGAVASIAFGHAEVAIDGNVLRVVARHRGIREPIELGPQQRQVRTTVGGWLDRDRAGDFNQALMELGATVCTPQSPRCDRCPVRVDCVAHAAGITDQLPVRRRQRATVEVDARVALVVKSGRVLGHRVANDQPNAGQIELPGGGILQHVESGNLAHVVRQRHGAVLEVDAELVTVRHAITHHRIVLHAHAATVRTLGSLAWWPLAPEVPWTTPSRKVFRATFDDRGARA
jgi:A/G-specific adenine glycosylase